MNYQDLAKIVAAVVIGVGLYMFLFDPMVKKYQAEHTEAV